MVLLCFDGSSDDAPQQTIDVCTQLTHRKTRLAKQSGFDAVDYSIVKVRSRLIVTRGDFPDAELRHAMFSEMTDLNIPVRFCEFDSNQSKLELSKEIFSALEFIRIYTKKPGNPVELKDPYVIPVGGTVEELASRVHDALATSLKFAKVQSPDDDGPRTVGRTHVLGDLDIVELHV